MPAPSQYYPEHDAMCCLCFGGFNKAQLYVYPNGDVFDVCIECQIDEAYAMNRRWNEDNL